MVGYNLDLAPGVVWIGIRAKPFPQAMSPAQRARRLQFPEDMIGPFPSPYQGDISEPVPSPWWPYANMAEFGLALGDNPNAIETMVVDILITRKTRGFPESPMCPLDVPEGPLPLWNISISTGQSIDDIANLFSEFFTAERAAFFTRDVPRVLLAVSNLPYHDLEEAMFRTLPTHTMHGLTVLLFGREQFAAWLSSLPDLWTLYFSPSLDFHVVIQHDIHLLHALFPHLLANEATDYQARTLPHPRLESTHLTAGTRLRVTGKMGAGKTTVVLQLLETQFKDTIQIILKPRLSDENAKILRRVMFPGFEGLGTLSL